MIFKVITPGDLAKDASLTALGFSPAALFAHLDTALVLGIANLLIVVIFRLVELRMKYSEKGEGGKRRRR